ncbi:MAG: WD40/YVTN/BNR-like repeat-containing protein [Candidatus Dormibacteraceae bacterium]
MTTIHVALEDGLLVLRGGVGSWEAQPQLEGRAPRCLASDPADPRRVWCGTDAGLWRSEDGGRSWSPGGEQLHDRAVSAVAVAPGARAIYAGIDPSAMWRSEDAGAHWHRLASFEALPSAPTWSFPPHPETSHVRWITLAPGSSDRLFVCVEAGALVRSADGGQTWTDRVPGGPFDTHTLAVHGDAPGRLYSAAGDGLMTPGHGYNESRDGGDTWSRPDGGLRHHYLYGLAVDAGDPDAIVVSAAQSPAHAHSPQVADSTVYRRRGTGPWQEVGQGLPASRGTLRTLFAAPPGEPGVFYAASNRGVYRSADQGASWEPVVAPLPDRFGGQSTFAVAAA